MVFTLIPKMAKLNATQAHSTGFYLFWPELYINMVRIVNIQGRFSFVYCVSIVNEAIKNRLQRGAKQTVFVIS